MHGNDMQMRLCIIKLGVVSSIYGDFWCMHAFINLKTFVRTQNLAFRMKSTESFIHEAPGVA